MAEQDGEELKSAIDEEIRQMFRQGQYSDAVPVIQQHLAANGEDVPAYDLMATALKFSGDKAGAAGALMTASDLWASQGNSLQSVAAQKKAMQLGVDPDYSAARACAPGQEAQRVPTPLLDELSDEEFTELAAGLESREYEEGAVIVAEGAPGDSMFIVTSGRLSVTTAKGCLLYTSPSPRD